MRIRQLLTHALLGVVLVLAWSATATAGKKSSNDLPIGGQTIGGPATGSLLNQDDMVTVFDEPGSGIDVCATIVNTSRTGIFDALLTAPSDNNSRTFNPEDQATICLKDTRTLKFTCTQAPCDFQYRIDKY